MPVHIEEMTSEVAVVEGELPLSDAQLERVVARVIQRLGEKEREARHARAATELRRGATPSLPIGD